MIKTAVAGGPALVLASAGTGAAPTAGGVLSTMPTPLPIDDDTPATGQIDFLRKLTWTGEIPPKL